MAFKSDRQRKAVMARLYTKNPSLKKRIFKSIRKYENLAMNSYEKGKIEQGKKYEVESDKLYRKNYYKIFGIKPQKGKSVIRHKNWSKMPSDDWWYRWRDDLRKKEVNIHPVGSKWQIQTNEFTRYANTKKEALDFVEDYMERN